MIMPTLNHMKNNPMCRWTFPEYLFFTLVVFMTIAGVFVFFPALILKYFWLAGLGGAAIITGLAIIAYVMDKEDDYL